MDRSVPAAGALAVGAAAAYWVMTLPPSEPSVLLGPGWTRETVERPVMVTLDQAVPLILLTVAVVAAIPAFVGYFRASAAAITVAQRLLLPSAIWTAIMVFWHLLTVGLPTEAAWVAPLAFAAALAATLIVGTDPEFWRDQVHAPQIAFHLALFVVNIVAGLDHSYGQPADPARWGPYTRLAEVGDRAFRNGVWGLPAEGSDLRLVVVDGQVMAATAQGLVTVEDDGRARVRARASAELRANDTWAPHQPVIGVAGERLVRWHGKDELIVVSLTPGANLGVRVAGVAEVSQVGPNGTMLVRAVDDEPGVLRHLGVHSMDQGVRAIEARGLPAVEAPDGLLLRGLLPVDGGMITVRSDRRGAGQVMHTSVSPPGRDMTSEVLAGAPDPVCGLDGDPLASHLGHIPSTSLVHDDKGNVWFAANPEPGTGSIIARIGVDGTLRYLDAPGSTNIDISLPIRLGTPGARTIEALAMDDDGALTAVATNTSVNEGSSVELWRLANAAVWLTEPSTTVDASCADNPPPATRSTASPSPSPA